MRARDQSSIFSTGGKFRPHYGLLLELHALTLVARSYALLGEGDSIQMVIDDYCQKRFFEIPKLLYHKGKEGKTGG